MAETVILLAISKISIALRNELARQVGGQFARHVTQLMELQGSMGRVMMELSVMHDSICEMDIRNRNNRGYEGWLKQVRKVVYDIEDMVDEYLYLVHKGVDRVGCCFYMKKQLKKPRSLLSLSRIASTVKEAERNLTHLSHTRERWVPMINNGDITNRSYTVQRSLDLASDSRCIGEEDLVGIEDSKKTLLEWLGEDDLASSIIILHGMGGLGKTTLAATVYKKERENFDCHAWVSISQTYARQDVLRRLVIDLFGDKQTVPNNISSMDLTTIRDVLSKFLERKKYLIMLDDVWSPDAYIDIFGAFNSNIKGSKIVLTTRIAEVAHLAFPGRILTLERLSEDDSWELFTKKAFPNLQCPGELENISKQIVDKCEGLPLAIVSIGSLLRVREKTKQEWKKIHDQLSWELSNNLSLDHVRNILYLSFIYLPTYLKSCFLYCSLFPEDYLFQRKKLIRLWIAEGFIEERGESTLEEVAEGYLKELVHSNMLLLVRRNDFGRMKSFRMHDIVRELAVDLCQRECFGVPYEEDKRGDESREKNGRRLVVHKQRDDSKQSTLCAYHLRSVVILDNSMPSSTLLPLIAEKCRYMSVLDLSGLPIEIVPDAIGDLFNLRHLGLRDSKVKFMPKHIEKLSNLMTLDLCRSNIQELPRGIVKLKKLRHLFAEKVNDMESWEDFQCRSGVRIPNDIGNLLDLQTLQALEANDDCIRHLGELRQMRSIRIVNVKGIYCKRLCESLVHMRFLSCLDLKASDKNEVIQLNSLNPSPPNLEKLDLSGHLAEGTFGESPLFQDARQNLHSLCLRWSELREDPLPCLSRFSNLTLLHFRRAYNGEQMLFLTEWFPKLKHLVLRDLPNLSRLEIQQGAMPSLESLILCILPSMTEIPPGIEFLIPLTFLHFGKITPDFLRLLRASRIMGGTRWQHSLRD